MGPKSAARVIALVTALNATLLNPSASRAFPSSAPVAMSAVPTPVGWRREAASGTIPASGTYTVAIPPELETVPVKGIDSYVSEFRSKSLRLVFDFGAYGSSGVEDCRQHPKACVIATMAVHGVRVGRVAYQVADPDGGLPYRAIYTILFGTFSWGQAHVGRISLVVSAECATARACALADRIVGTINVIPDR